MEERRELRRMPRGERCPECGSRKWQLQDGLRFCSRGHQIEGFVQFDVGDEEGSGRLGPVTRRQKETREREKRQLAGPEGKTLYLEALQLLLRNQVLWLVHEKGHRAELETVVRDLWDLRIRGFSSLARQDDDDSARDHLELFSSQTPPEVDQVAWKSRSRGQSWLPERGADWPIPRLPETLALCCLGSLLLRTPTRLGELLDWANNGYMPYKTAYHGLPPEMQDRMPSAYVKALKLPLRSSLGGGQLYRTVMDLVLSYNLNYGMVFPELGYVSMLVQYAKMLALPVESIVATKSLSASLECRFHFPVGKAKIVPLDHPEIRLVALLIIATKLCFPFQGSQPPLQGHGAACLPCLDWESWRHGLVQDPGEGKSSRREANFDEVTPNQVVHMNDEELEAYLAHVTSLVDKTNSHPVTQFFPTTTPTEASPPVPELSEEERDGKASRLLNQTLGPSQELGSTKADGPSGAGNIAYETFRSVEDLSETAAALYKAAGDAAGIPLDMVVRAVYMQEQRMISWQKKRREMGLADDAVLDE